MALILDILHPDGTRTRRRLDGTTLSLGRALSNDVILDDPYVDARHARIAMDESGTLAIEDLGSVNGMLAGAAGRQARLPLHAGAELRVGRTVLRVRDADEPVPPALVDAPAGTASETSSMLAAAAHALRPELLPPVFGTSAAGVAAPWTTRAVRWSETTAGRIAIVSAAFVLIALNTWLGHYERSTASEVLTNVLAFAFAGAIWAGIWSIGTRVATQRFHFGGHFAVVAAITVAGWALMTVEEWYEFFVPDSVVASTGSMVAGFALLSAMIAWHLSLSSRMSRARRWRTGIFVSVALVALGGLFALAEGESFSDVPTFSGVVKPVGAAWLPTTSVDGFGAVMTELKAEVDELATP